MNKNRGMDMEEQPKRDNTLLIVLMIVAICFLLVQLGMKIAYYQELSEQATKRDRERSLDKTGAKSHHFSLVMRYI